MIDKNKFYSKSQLAETLGLSWDTLRDRIAGLIPALEQKHQYQKKQKVLLLSLPIIKI